MSSFFDSGVHIQASSCSVPSTPSWFGEVAVIAHTLRRLGVLTMIEVRVRFARRRFGHYDLSDFAVVLIGYAISGERTLEAFHERVFPFASPFMALFGRERLPHRSTLSRFLAALDQASVEALRTLFNGSACFLEHQVQATATIGELRQAVKAISAYMQAQSVPAPQPSEAASVIYGPPQRRNGFWSNLKVYRRLHHTCCISLGR